MDSLSAVVLTKNEENHLPACLDSLQWCSNLLVLDSFSSDSTVEIAREKGARVEQRAFTNFADQRNAAIDLVETPWVLFVDADERVSPELVKEIEQVVQSPIHAGYWIPTHNYQLGRLILHAGLYPDEHLRLFRKACGRYDPAQEVHEKVLLEGSVGRLKNPLLHISCESWDDFTCHQDQYARIKAKIHYERGVRPSYHFVAGPILEFYRRYFILKGYRDGWHGLKLSFIFARYYLKMFVYLNRLWRTRAR